MTQKNNVESQLSMHGTLKTPLNLSLNEYCVVCVYSTTADEQLIFVTTCCTVGFERKGVAISFPMQQKVAVKASKMENIALVIKIMATR